MSLPHLTPPKIGSNFLSRKLWVFITIALSLLWLGQGEFVRVVDGLLLLTGVYLVSQAINDIGSDFAKAWEARERIRSATAIEVARIEQETRTGTVRASPRSDPATPSVTPPSP